MPNRARRPHRRSRPTNEVARNTRSELDEVEDIVVELVGESLQRGWLPTELTRYLSNRSGRYFPDLVGIALMRERRENPVVAHPRWLDELDEVSSSHPDLGYSEFAERVGVSHSDLIDASRVLTLLLPRLPRITVVCPPPGSPLIDSSRSSTDGPVDAKVLARIRGLLAKAEASTFTEEAEAFTSKAQLMMTKYSIERALLDDPDGVAPAAMRIWHDAPYTSQKASLLSEIAVANACRSVWNKGLVVSTVFGFDADLAAVELLYTSLLVQANSEMARAAEAGDYDRKRVKSFRASFLIGFADRVGQRLREVRDAGAEAAAQEAGSDLLPVLASRDGLVEAALATAFPSVGTYRVSLSNGEGYRAGTIAADRAQLGPRGGRLRPAG